MFSADVVVVVVVVRGHQILSGYKKKNQHVFLVMSSHCVKAHSVTDTGQTCRGQTLRRCSGT